MCMASIVRDALLCGAVPEQSGDTDVVRETHNEQIISSPRPFSYYICEGHVSFTDYLHINEMKWFLINKSSLIRSRFIACIYCGML